MTFIILYDIIVHEGKGTMINHKKFIEGYNQAVEESLKSKAKRRVGSVLLDQNGNIISKGRNSDTRRHSIMTRFPPADENLIVFDKFEDNTSWNPKKVFLHSEACCISKVTNLNLEGCTLIVVRTLKNGKISMAKPCGNCMSIINHYRIKEIIYSDWNGEMVREILR